MSAHRLYCYGPQRKAVITFLQNLGAPISSDSPHAVHEAEQLRGIEHVSFVAIDNHPNPIPQSMWEIITTYGAIVIHVDDQYVRERADRLFVHHYPGEGSAGSVETTR